MRSSSLVHTYRSSKPRRSTICTTFDRRPTRRTPTSTGTSLAHPLVRPEPGQRSQRVHRSHTPLHAPRRDTARLNCGLHGHERRPATIPPSPPTSTPRSPGRHRLCNRRSPRASLRRPSRRRMMPIVRRRPLRCRARPRTDRRPPCQYLPPRRRSQGPRHARRPSPTTRRPPPRRRQRGFPIPVPAPPPDAHQQPQQDTPLRQRSRRRASRPDTRDLRLRPRGPAKPHPRRRTRGRLLAYTLHPTSSTSSRTRIPATPRGRDPTVRSLCAPPWSPRPTSRRSDRLRPDLSVCFNWPGRQHRLLFSPPLGGLDRSASACRCYPVCCHLWPCDLSRTSSLARQFTPGGPSPMPAGSR